MTMFNRSPMEEIGKRTAESGAGLAAAAHAQAVQNQAHVLQEARQRTADSHAFRMQNIGGTSSQVEPDSMGNILVTGDVYGDQAVKALRTALGDSQPNGQPPTAPDAPHPKPASTFAKCAMAAALMFTGAGAATAVPWLIGMFNQPPPVVEQPEHPLQQIIVE